MDIEAVDTAGGEHIAQALQRRADQGGAAIPFIQKLHGFRDDETISRDALAQRGYLTCHGVRLGLLLRRHPGVECDLYGVHACCLLPTCCVCGARSAGWGAPARGAGRRVIGTTRSYACATQVGLPQLGSNVMRTARVMLLVGARRATRVSLPPGRGAFTGRHTLQRCPQKPVPIARAQLGSWHTGRELYKKVCNFVGGVVSPVLSNIYLDKLDKFVERILIPEYTKGDKRGRNPAYGQVAHQLQTARRQGDLERVRALKKALRQYPSKTPDDPGYRRLRYIRYADDFLFGFAGPFEEANQIKDKVASFLQTELKLTLSAEKTLITHAQTGRARFLGYEIGIMYSATKLNRLGTRGVNGVVGMYIPEDVIQAKRKRYLRGAKPIHRPELQNDSEYDIIIRYQGEYRGLVQYYGLAHNLAQLGYVKWTMETSLLKTLASKNHTSVTKESKRLKATTKTSDGPRKCLKLTIQREKKTPLIAIFGGLSLKRRKHPLMEDRVILPYVQLRSEIVERLLNDTCEVCGEKKNVQMHHVRHLRDLNKKGKREMPLWMKVMIMRKRKSIPLCKGCHDDVHHNRPKSKRQGNQRAG